MHSGSIRDTFTAALDRLIEQVKQDRSVLAAVLCGSLSHDTVWEKSDIDLVLVTLDDRQTSTTDVALYADGRNVHALLMPRTEFRRIVDGSVANSFVHSFLAKGKLLYTHDRTIADLCDRLQARGARDTDLQLLRSATAALPPLDKARKWMVTRGDLEYASLWILYAATPLARIEVLAGGLIADREVLPQAMALNPAFFKVVYADLLNTRKTHRGVQAALDAADRYLADRAATLFRPILEHLEEVGEVRSSTEIENHFKRHCDLSGVTIACEYLADRGLVGKASTSVRLTKKSNVDVQELAFFHTAAPGSER